MSLSRSVTTRHIRVLTASIAVMAMTAACTVASTSEFSADGAITIAIDSDYNSLDPATMNSASAYSLSLALYDPLVVSDGRDGFEPGLAARWTDTPRTIRFVLRPDVSCSDGSDVTAETVKRSLDHLADPETASPNRARTFGNGDVRVSADNATRSVTIRNSEPFNDMLLGLSGPWAGIACGSGADDYDSASGEAPAGTGAWKLDADASTRRSHYVLNRRADYQARPGVVAEELAEHLIFRVISDQSTVANELVAGGLDLGNVGVLNASALEAEESLHDVQLPTYGSIFLYFRQGAESPFRDDRVRRAVAHALNRDEAADAATAGLGEVPPSYLSDDVACTDGVRGASPVYDPSAAEELMRSSGYHRDDDGFWEKNGQRLTVALLANPTNYAAGNEYVQNRLRAFGVDVSLEERPTPEVLEKMATSDTWDASLFPYGPPISSPNSATSFMASESDSNWAGIQNSAFDSGAATGIGVARDDPLRCRAWEAAQRSLVTAADIVPLWSADTFWFASDDIDVSGLQSASGFSVDPTTFRVK